MNKEIILIGGKFHRKKIKINEGQNTIKVPLLPELILMDFSDPKNIQEIKYVEYVNVSKIFYINEILPDCFFLEKTINPVDFIRNLILDYISGDQY